MLKELFTAVQIEPSDAVPIPVDVLCRESTKRFLTDAAILPIDIAIMLLSLRVL